MEIMDVQNNQIKKLMDLKLYTYIYIYMYIFIIILVSW
jgi:hypothetical protein